MTQDNSLYKEDIERVDTWSDRKSPISHLPLELLTEVFLHVAAAERRCFAFPKIKLQPPAIMKVCRQWRNLALSAPQLHTMLSFDFPYHFSYSHRVCPGHPDQDQLRWCLDKGLKQWIRSSINCPLDIELQLDTSCGTCEQNFIEPAWRLLIQQFSRWRSLYLSERELPTLWKLLLNAGGIAVHLEELILICHDIMEELHDESSIVVMPHSVNCPRLRKLTIDLNVTAGAATQLMHLIFQLNAPALEHLDLRSVSKLERSLIQTINTNFSTVRRLRISASIRKAPPHNQYLTSLDVGFRLPYLTHCDLSSADFSIQLFDPSLVEECPNLARLDFSCYRFTILDGYCLVELRFQSMKSLRLEILEQEDIGVHIHQFMLCFPVLEELKLAVTWNTDVNCFIDALLLGGACPLLGSVFISRGYADRDKLVELMSNRSVETSIQRRLLLTLSDCRKLPDVELMDAEAFQLALQQYDVKHPTQSDSG